MVAEKLRHARTSKKLSQQTVAAHLDIPTKIYQNYERGESEPPVEIIEKLCKLLEVSSDWVLGMSNQK